jgi:hypothetical protein
MTGPVPAPVQPEEISAPLQWSGRLLHAGPSASPAEIAACQDARASLLDRSRGLLEHLRAVADHRKARGKRHPLEAILVVIAVAKLCGADSVYAVGQFAATMPQQALARCGLRPSPAAGRCHPPSLKTIKRAIRHIDAHQADAALCAWLRQEAAAGKAPHLLAAYDVTGGTAAAQHNEITYFADLLACPGTSTGDSGAGTDAGG